MTTLEAVTDLLGDENVIRDGTERSFYAHDVLRPGILPDAVLRPGSIEELQQIVKLAYDEGCAVVVRGGGASYTDAYAHTQENGLTIDTSRLKGISIDEHDATVTVEPGVTWLELRETLLKKGFRTRFWGSYSGLHATVSGGMSMNALSHGVGSAAEHVISFDIITGTGEMLSTGSAVSGKSKAFFRNYGPDLTGLFTADCGALGVKARITLPLYKARSNFATVSFNFTSFAAMHEASRLVALEDITEEQFGLNEVLQQGQLGKATASEKARMAGNIVKQSGLLKGAGKLAKMAVSDEKEIAQSKFAMHFITEGITSQEAKIKIERVREICSKHGEEIPNSVPEVVRANPFAPFHNVLGPKGERWVPVHGLFPHSKAVAFCDALNDLLEREADVRQKHEIVVGGMFMAVNSTSFLYEPTFYWPDEQTIYHKRVVEKDYLDNLPTYPESTANREAALKLKQQVVDLIHEMGGVHLQIGKAYPYSRDHDPVHWETLKSIKAQLDPKGILNPGSLGL